VVVALKPRLALNLDQQLMARKPPLVLNPALNLDQILAPVDLKLPQVLNLDQ